MLYKQVFGNDFNLGFQLNEYPLLVDKSWHNDMCPSFYFKHINQYYILWVDFLNQEDREEENFRYTIITAINEGDEHSPEIYSGNGDIVFETEKSDELNMFMNFLLTQRTSIQRTS
jgi:hypothetical protein